MICVVFAHPYPRRSRANRALVDALRPIPSLELRSLYELYPDFDIDVAAEQAALLRARLVIWMHPVYWYSVPGLLKHWFDQVLTPGWAYGDGGGALRGKHCLWVATAGGDEQSYSAQGIHGQPFMNVAAPLQQTARFCGMHWEQPFILHGAELLEEGELRGHAQRLRGRVDAWLEGVAPSGAAAVLP